MKNNKKPKLIFLITISIVTLGMISLLIYNTVFRKYYVTPLEFGAYEDGIHDDHKAIQKCIDDVSPCFFNARHYKIDSTVTIYDDNEIINGNMTTIYTENNSPVLKINGNYNTLRDIGLISRGDTSQVGIEILGSNNYLDGCDIKFLGTGIYIRNKSCGNVILNNSIYRCGKAGLKIAGANNSIIGGRITDCNPSVILKNESEHGEISNLDLKSSNHFSSVIHEDSQPDSSIPKIRITPKKYIHMNLYIGIHVMPGSEVNNIKSLKNTIIKAIGNSNDYDKFVLSFKNTLKNENIIADTIVPVRINMNGVKKDYTFEEFKKLIYTDGYSK